MYKARLALRVLTLVTFTIAFAAVAQAQATRTWVSGVGDDVNPCSRTAPCKTFAGAISKTATNGEINCLDPGGFGAVTISKSITIDCEDTQGSILASGVTGILINLTANPDVLKTVRLRGLSINGAGSSTRSGLRGINVSSANTGQPKLFTDELIIHGFVNEGILFNANGGHMVLQKTTTIDNGTAGVRADSNGVNVVRVSIDDSHSDLNGQEGYRIEDNVRAAISHSTANNNGLNGYSNVVTTSASEMTMSSCAGSNNGQSGAITAGATATIRVANSELINNVTSGVSPNTGQILTNQKNRVTAPTGTFTGNFLDL